MDQSASQQKLPAGLAGVLNHPDEQRDSAYFSNHDTSSKHTSTQSSNGGHVLTPPSSGYQSSIHDKTPSPITTHLLTQPLNSPTSGGMSVASMVSPTTPASADAQSMHNRFSRQSYEAGPMSGSLSMNGDPDSRRQSINSQLGHTFGDMRLAASPYASNNQSTTSIQSTLQQQRNPGAAQDRNSTSRFSNSYAPNSHRLPDALSPLSPKQLGPKTAPTITGPALGNIARAPEPTKGQAWAFPEEEIQRNPSQARPSVETGGRQGKSFLVSRRSSIADSTTSSQFTAESRLPPGQRRLEDGMPSDYIPRESSEFQSHHHHQLQHKQLSDLQDGRSGSPGSTQPYSRTPELRVSHKLAERKRRTEMKELFEMLRDLMPQERGSKASKWEILTKAISEHQRLHRELVQSRENSSLLSQETETSRREASTLRLENAQLRAEVARLNGFQSQGNEQPRVNGATNLGDTGFNQPHYENNRTAYVGGGSRALDTHNMSKSHSTSLPPIRALPANAGMSEDMTGVQYNDTPATHGYPEPQQHRPNGFDPSRVNGFQRSSEPRPVGHYQQPQRSF